MDDGSTTPLALDAALEREKIATPNLPWPRVPKLQRIAKLSDFCDRYATENGLDVETKAVLWKYLRGALDNRRIHRAKDVVYDNETGMLTAIPGLKYYAKTQRYTLKREETVPRTVRKRNTPKDTGV